MKGPVLSDRGRLNLKLALAILGTFVLAVICTWFVQERIVTEEIHEMIASTFSDVKNEIVDVTNEQLVREAMAAREILEDGWPTDCESLQRLSNRLRVTDLSIADGKGIIVASAQPQYLGFDFNKGDQARPFLCLLDTETEYCQPLQRNDSDGVLRKYVGVWRPEGGFVQIGCDTDALANLTRSSLMGLFENWNVGGAGGIVVVSRSGFVLSDYEVPSRMGTQWQEPDDRLFYWERREIEGFPVYVLVPRSAVTDGRNEAVRYTAVAVAAALALVAFIVAGLIASFVRRQLRAQSAKELEMATSIQNSALPNVFPPFPHETRFDIWASMTTAKEVGGDFYDFYFTAEDRVLFLVADVSGKGVPAALFMMRAKVLFKTAAQTGKPLDQVFEEVNDTLCEGNTSNTFVTLWAGELNLHTGLVTFVNGGHNAPIVRRSGVAAYLRTKPSLVLGVMPGVRYHTDEVRLAPGDALYLYTDGITEQRNRAKEFYGEARLLGMLSRPAYFYRPAELLKGVVADVREFAQGVEQSDDCTQLVIRYRGATDVHHRDYKPTMADLAQATQDLEAAIAHVPARERMQLMVAADEIFANIVRYSQATAWTLSVEETHYPEGVRLVFTDDGLPFDPLEHRDPDTTLKAEDRQVGGLGILIVKKTMSPVTYARREGKNVLTIGKDYGNQDQK